jgi:chromatin segregation and condensation protein Rec8/ScpA/Scc1 (kleisin family)
MTEIVLTIVIVALLGYHAYCERLHKQEREKMMNAIVAKNAQELRDLTLAENTEIKVKPPGPPDLEPLENLSDQQHLDAIMGRLKTPQLSEEENG